MTEPLAELPPRPPAEGPGYVDWLERENYLLRQIVQRQASRARLWAGLGAVLALGFAVALGLVLGAAYGARDAADHATASSSSSQDLLEVVRREQVAGTVRGYKNRAVACAAVQAAGSELPEPCLEPAVLRYFDPFRPGP